MSWKTVELGDVCEFTRGLTYSKVDEVEFSNNAVLRATNIDLESNKLNLEEIRYINSSVKINEDKKIKLNDILICTASGSKSHLGKVALINEQLDMAFGGFMAVLRVKETIEAKFLFNYLTSDIFLNHVSRLADGANINNLKFSQIQNLKINLPPLSTQQKIVTKLDAIFAEIDTAKVATEANANNAEALFQSYLNEVFERGGEGWVVKKLKDITEKIGSGATPRGGNESYKASGISLIRSMNVYDEGFYYPKLAFIDEAQAKELDNVKVENEDVLLNITGASIARCCVVPEDVLPARVNQHVSILRANKNIIIPKLIHYILISPVHKNKLLSVGEDGGATRQALTKAQLLEYEINFPSSLSSQLKLVEKISNFYSYTFSIKNNYEEKIRNFPSLKQSILQKAFSGELVKD